MQYIQQIFHNLYNAFPWPFQPFVFAYDVVLYVHENLHFFLKNIIKTDPALWRMLAYTFDYSALYLRVYYLFFILRLSLFWFPNVNPYIAPWYSIIAATQPPLDYVGKRIPAIFGLDFSFMIVTTAITLAIGYLDKLAMLGGLRYLIVENW